MAYLVESVYRTYIAWNKFIMFPEYPALVNWIPIPSACRRISTHITRPSVTYMVCWFWLCGIVSRDTHTWMRWTLVNKVINNNISIKLQPHGSSVHRKYIFLQIQVKTVFIVTEFPFLFAVYFEKQFPDRSRRRWTTTVWSACPNVLVHGGLTNQTRGPLSQPIRCVAQGFGSRSPKPRRQNHL